MLELLRSWLNGNREYYSGVALFVACSKNEALIKLFRQGKTDYTNRRLQEELLLICSDLKSKPGKDVVIKSVPAKSIVSNQSDTPLYIAAKTEADKAFKAYANARAHLFALAAPNDFTDPNTPDKIQSRQKLAIDVVLLYQKSSELYERADYVKQTGRLPTSEESEVNEYDALPDHLVKQTLDNLRKNVNKLKKREPTAERLALIEKHSKNIKKLSEKWLLLKPR